GRDRQLNAEFGMATKDLIHVPAHLIDLHQPRDRHVGVADQVELVLIVERTDQPVIGDSEAVVFAKDRNADFELAPGAHILDGFAGLIADFLVPLERKLVLLGRAVAAIGDLYRERALTLIQIDLEQGQLVGVLDGARGHTAPAILSASALRAYLASTLLRT